jgi:starvation-inducible DNA-binding protein
VAQIDATLVGVRKAITELNDIDLTSQDVVLEIARGLEKSRWFLAAHIAE